MKLSRDTTLATAVATTFGLTIYSMITHDPYAMTILALLTILLVYDMFSNVITAIKIAKSIRTISEISAQYSTVVEPELTRLRSAVDELRQLNASMAVDVAIIGTKSTKDVEEFITHSIDYVAATTRKDIDTIANDVAAVKGEVANLQMANGFKKLK